MALKDYISKLPIATIERIYINNLRVVFPTQIDTNKFYEDLSGDIKQPSLTTEKAIFAASMKEPSQYKSAFDLLVSKLKF